MLTSPLLKNILEPAGKRCKFQRQKIQLVNTPFCRGELNSPAISFLNQDWVRLPIDFAQGSPHPTRIRGWTKIWGRNQDSLDRRMEQDNGQWVTRILLQARYIILNQ